MLRDTPSERLYALQDALFNVVALTDTTGAVVERFAYQPYGESEELNPDYTVYSGTDYGWTYRFTGRELDLETGLQLNRNRYLHLQLGRWSTRDPIGYDGGINLYAYAAGSPAMQTDDIGFQPGFIQNPIMPGHGFKPVELIPAHIPPEPIPCKELAVRGNVPKCGIEDMKGCRWVRGITPPASWTKPIVGGRGIPIPSLGTTLCDVDFVKGAPQQGWGNAARIYAGMPCECTYKISQMCQKHCCKDGKWEPEGESKRVVGGDCDTTKGKVVKSQLGWGCDCPKPAVPAGAPKSLCDETITHK